MSTLLHAMNTVTVNGFSSSEILKSTCNSSPLHKLLKYAHQNTVLILANIA